MPCQLLGTKDATMPAAKKGNTSQFGMRRLRKSVKVDTERTRTVGHQAIECNSDPLIPHVSTEYVSIYAIVPPNHHKSRCINSMRYTEVVTMRCTRLFTAPNGRWR